MDESLKQYVGEFVAEAREHLDNMNNSLLVLEKDPKNKDVINGLFRSFHTVKGNSAALGFSNLAELAHQLENILGKIRDNELAASGEVIDVLLEGIDGISRGIDKIEGESSDAIDFGESVAKIKSILPASSVKKEKTILSLTPLETSEAEKYRKEGFDIFYVRVAFKPNLLLKEAKSLIVFRNIASFGKLVASNPRKDQLANLDDILELVVAAKNPADISANLSISGVEKVGTEVFTAETLSKVASASLAAKPNSSSAAPTAAAAMQLNKAHEEKSKAAALDIAKETQSVRINIDRLDKLMEMVGELVINRMRLSSVAEKYESKELSEILVNIDRLALGIQEEVIEERMVPIGQIYNKFPRMIRDLAVMEGKKVNFLTEGNDITFDRTVLDEIGDPLVHILRNSVDHGIEAPQSRIASGKPEEGVVKISARRERGFAIVEVEDDGGGIDIEEVKNVAVRKGLLSEKDKEKLPDEDARMLIFNPGMSTSKEVTEISGRGVGMSVVKDKVGSLGGRIKLESTKGKGTKISMHLPLTVAIIQALLVKVKDDTYAIPISSVDLIEEVPKDKIKTIQGKEVFILFDSEVPLLWLHDLFGDGRSKKDDFVVVIVEHAEKKIGLVVDSILREQQILIKTLSNTVKHIKGFAGATILGNGEVCLILDISSLIG